MLKRMVLQNIAIIEALDISFKPGLNVITGETGSGKSLLLESLARVFDKKSSLKDLLGNRQPRGFVELTFDWAQLAQNEAVQACLSQAGVMLGEGEKELVLSREITGTGSRARINGCLVSMDVMTTLGSLLFEMFGQHDLHLLFSTARQRDLLDNLGGEPLLAVKAQVRQAYLKAVALRAERDMLAQQQLDLEQRHDFLKYQIQEILDAELKDAAEDAVLKQERERLANKEKLLEAALKGMHLLTGGDEPDSPALLTLLHQLKKAFNEVGQTDPQFEIWLESLVEVEETLKTMSHDFYRYSASFETQSDRMQHVIDRLDMLEKLKRKYGGSLEAVFKTAAQLEAELDIMQSQSTRLKQVEEELKAFETHHLALCYTLTELRASVAEHLTESIRKELDELMLPRAQFGIQFSATVPGESGQETVAFMFSANPGEPLKPLAQVASGGELARLMLAIKVHTAYSDGVSVLVLDEIDAAISGVTVRAVSDKLVRLSQQCQIIAVTHQTILAAKAPWHLHVQKQILPDSVKVTATPLIDPRDRQGVLSQLASGLSEETVATSRFIQQLSA